MSQPNDLLGVPRAVVIAIALPGLVLFVGVMGFATHAGLAEFAPGLPSWAALALSAAVPLLALLGVGLYGALHDSPATSEATRRSRIFQFFFHFIPSERHF